MAQRGKRKASAAPSTTSRTPRKKINLNGATPARARPNRARKSIVDTFHPAEGVIDPTRGSLPKQKGRSSSAASIGSNFSLATIRSKFSNPFRSFTPTLTSWGKAVKSYNIPELVKKRLNQKEKNSNLTKMNGIGSKKIDIKGKGKAIEEDEDDHLSADESARMIELLDTPVSVRPWQLVNGHAQEADEDSDAQSDHSVENLLIGDDQEEIKATASDAEDSSELDERVKLLNDDVVDIRLGDGDSMKGVEEAATTSRNPLTTLNGDLKTDAAAQGKRLKEHEARHINGDDVEGEAVDQSGAVSSGTLDDPPQRISEGGVEEILTDHALDRSSIAIHESTKDDLAQDDSIEASEQDVSPLRNLNGSLHYSSSVREERDQDTVDDEAGKDDANNNNEKDNWEEASILMPKDSLNDVIDLTESTSAEEETEKSLDKAIEPQVSSTIELRRQPSSGLFANGVMARERRLSDGFSATRVIQQLGSRQMSASSSYAKPINKSSYGFKKREPIFNRTRKSLAKEITTNKKNAMLSTLRRRATMMLHAPYFLEDMLKKKVALEKAQGDDTPEEEVQIRHLRAILARSTASLRPARRHLKQQERLAMEAKLLQKRALGIMGRQPLPRNLPNDRADFVQQTFRKEGKIAQVVGAAVLNRDIIKLRPGVWLNDEVINFYMKLILKRSDEAITKRANARAAKKRLTLNEYGNSDERVTDQALVKEMNKVWNGIWNCWTFTSFFYTKIETEGYSGVRQWTRKVDIFTKDVLLLPINISSTHWVCASINMRKCRFEYYDSMRSRPRGVFEQLKRYLVSEYEDKKKQCAGPLLLDGWDYYVSQQSPLQENAFDCGVFACQTLEQLSRRSPRDYELKDDLNLEKIVQKSRELAEAKRRRDDSSESDEESSHAAVAAIEEEEEEEEWNFSQINIPYLRQRMVYEIANTALLNE